MRYRSAISIFIALVFALTLPCCGSGGGGGTLSVKLELPAGADPAIFSQDDRIVVRVYGPDFDQMQYEFARSSGKGTIEGIPEGEDRVIKVDEYDSGGNLLARGFSYGLRLTEGEDRSVSVVMVPKGWVITIAGGIGAGDSPDGTYAGDALLNGPAEVEYIENHGLFFLDANNYKIKIINNVWKIKDLVGNGQSGTVIEDVNALNTPITNPCSIAVDENGKIYFSVFIENKIFQISNKSVKRFGGNGENGYADENSGAINSPIYRPKSITYIELKGLYFVESVFGAVRLINENGNIADNLNLTETEIGGFGFQGKDSIFSHSYGKTIFMIDNANKKITQFGDLGYFDTWVNYPDSMIYNGCVFGYFPHYLFLCGDSFSSKVYRVKYDSDGLIENNTDHVYGSAPGSILQPLPPDSAGLVNPRDVTVDPDGNLYIADTGNNAIRMVVGGGL